MIEMARICMHAPLIDGFGHATWSATVPGLHSHVVILANNHHFIFRALVALELLVSL